MVSAVVSRFGRRVKTERERRGWSLESLSARSGVSRAAISNLENARYGSTLDSAVSLAAVLGISLDGLTGPEPQP